MLMGILDVLNLKSSDELIYSKPKEITIGARLSFYIKKSYFISNILQAGS